MRVRVASNEWERPGTPMHTYAELVLASLRTQGIDSAPLPFRCWGASGKHGGAVGPFLARHWTRYPPHDSDLVHDTTLLGTLRGVDVGTIHDLYPFHESSWHAWLARDAIRLTLRRARRTIVTSDFILQEIGRVIGPPLAERVRRVYIPYEPVPERRLPQRFEVLWVGSAHPRKRLSLLLDALEGLPTLRAAVRWKPDPTTPELNRSAERRLAQIPTVTSFPRSLSPEEMDQLFRESACFVSTSDYEGFQRPVVEGYLRGARVVVPDDEGVPAAQLLRGQPGVHTYRPADTADLRRAIVEAAEAGPFPVSQQVRDLLSVENAGRGFRAVYEEIA